MHNATLAVSTWKGPRGKATQGPTMSAAFSGHGDEPGAGSFGPLLYNVVYCSQASAGVGDDDVDNILASARRANPEHGITGMLVFGSGVFMQWLEGPRDNVSALMALLRKDKRHHNIVLLSETEELRERLFPDWDMERVSAEHIREVLVDAQGSAHDPKVARTLQLMITSLDGGLLTPSAAGRPGQG
jgi:hypothetical protein